MKIKPQCTIYANEFEDEEMGKEERKGGMEMKKGNGRERCKKEERRTNLAGFSDTTQGVCQRHQQMVIHPLAPTLAMTCGVTIGTALPGAYT